MIEQVDFRGIHAKASSRVIRDLKEENRRLSEALRQMVQERKVQAKETAKELTKLKAAVCDYRSALMEWMPMLRHTDSETARIVAVAMRKLRNDIEERMNG